jgi:hypothetical protein
VVGEGGLSDVEMFRYVAGGQIAPSQQVQDGASRVVVQGAEELRHDVRLIIRQSSKYHFLSSPDGFSHFPALHDGVSRLSSGFRFFNANSIT